MPARPLATAWGLAVLAGLAGVGLGRVPLPALPSAVLVCGGFGAVYLGGATALGMPEVGGLVRRLRQR
jgi:hypothetical protein